MPPLDDSGSNTQKQKVAGEADFDLKQFYSQYKGTLDQDHDGYLTTQEVINGFGNSNIKHNDVRYLKTLKENFSDLASIDHWYSSTISENDIDAFADRQTEATKTDIRAKEITKFLDASFSKLDPSKSGVITKSALENAISASKDESEKKLLTAVMQNFDNIGNCSGDEWFWESRHISKADIKAYVETVQDWLVNDTKFYSEAKTDWIPNAPSRESARIKDFLKNANWSDGNKEEFAVLGDAMISGNAESIESAIRRIENKNNVAFYASELNKLFNVEYVRRDNEPSCVHFDYSVWSGMSKDKSHFLIETDCFQLSVPLDPKEKTTAKFGATGWLGKWTKGQSQNPEYVAHIISSLIRNPRRHNTHSFV